MGIPNLGPNHDLAIRLSSADIATQRLSTRDVLQNASIGAGGLLVYGGGSITITGTGTLNVASGGLNSAGSIVAGTTVTAGTTLNSVGDTNVGGNANVTGTVNVPNSTVVSAYARAHSVSTAYVACYINSDGSFLSTISARRFKREIRPHTWTPDQWRAVEMVSYQLRHAWILADMRGDDPATVERLVGVIGEQLLKAGLPELVVLDAKGRVFTVRYEWIGLVALDAAQQLASQIEDLRGEMAELRKLVADRNPSDR